MTGGSWEWGVSQGHWGPSSLQVTVNNLFRNYLPLTLYSCPLLCLAASPFMKMTFFFRFLTFSYKKIMKVLCHLTSSPPTPSSIETAKQKLEKDRLRREADLKIAAKQKKLAELQKKFKQLLNKNQSLPEHVRLTPQVQTHKPEPLIVIWFEYWCIFCHWSCCL